MPLENRRKFSSRSNRKILCQNLIFRYGLSNRKIKIFTSWALKGSSVIVNTTQIVTGGGGSLG